MMDAAVEWRRSVTNPVFVQPDARKHTDYHHRRPTLKFIASVWHMAGLAIRAQDTVTLENAAARRCAGVSHLFWLVPCWFHIPVQWFKPFILLVLVVMAVYTFAKKTFGQNQRSSALSKNEWYVGLACGALIGFTMA